MIYWLKEHSLELAAAVALGILVVIWVLWVIVIFSGDDSPDITVWEDPDRDVVCYAYDGFFAGGISCLESLPRN